MADQIQAWGLWCSIYYLKTYLQIIIPVLRIKNSAIVTFTFYLVIVAMLMNVCFWDKL